MKSRLTVLVLFVGVCSLWGCVKANEPVPASAPQAVNQSDEPVSALNLPIVERLPGHPLPELQIWHATPAPGSVTAEGAKPNEAAVASSIPAKKQNSDGKPAEMKVSTRSNGIHTFLPE